MKNGPYELVIAPPGYPGKLYRKRYCYEHHLVWWQKTGQILSSEEEIHHKNEQKRDNQYENLEKIAKTKHKRLHGGESHERSAHDLVCPQCQKPFKVYGHQFLKRTKQTLSGHLFCSHSCQATWQHKHH